MLSRYHLKAIPPGLKGGRPRPAQVGTSTSRGGCAYNTDAKTVQPCLCAPAYHRWSRAGETTLSLDRDTNYDTTFSDSSPRRATSLQAAREQPSVPPRLYSYKTTSARFAGARSEPRCLRHRTAGLHDAEARVKAQHSAPPHLTRQVKCLWLVADDVPKLPVKSASERGSLALWNSTRVSTGVTTSPIGVLMTSGASSSICHAFQEL